jgi:hypothetical protein
MKKALSLFAVILLIQVKSIACSCFPVGRHFCETIHNDTSIRNVVMVQKIATVYYGAQFRLIQHIAGVMPADTFMVWGDNGALCRIYISGVPNGDTLIFALNQCDTSGNFIWDGVSPPDLESVNDYHINGCGVYALSVNNGMVEGWITDTLMQSIPLNNFLALPCILLSTDEKSSNEIHLFPNPAKEQVTIENLPTQTVIRVYNSVGDLIFTAQINNTVYRLETSAYSRGIYLIEIELSEGNSSRKKLLVE